MRTRPIGVAGIVIIALFCIAFLTPGAATHIGGQPASPGAPAARPPLAFVANGRPSRMYSEEYGIYQIYVVSGRDNGLMNGLDTPLTPREGNADSPAWSPDGTRMTFTFRPAGSNTSYIEVMNGDGSARQRLTHGGSEYAPAWSPDGRTIAYVTQTDGAIEAMDADGGNVRRLHGAIGARELDWSPDGKRLLVTARDDVYLMDADGAHTRRLLSGAEFAHSATWSPDGRRIAYASGHGLFLTEDEGRTSRPLTLTGYMTFAIDAEAVPTFADLDWSPSGRELAVSVLSPRLQMAVSTPVPLDRIGWQIMIIDVDSGEASLVTHGFDNHAPEWQPLPLAARKGR